MPQAAAAVDAAAGAGGGEAAAEGGAAAGEGPASADRQLISWRQLERLGGQPALGKTLELRVVSQPVAFLRSIFEGKRWGG